MLDRLYEQLDYFADLHGVYKVSLAHITHRFLCFSTLLFLLHTFTKLLGKYLLTLNELTLQFDRE